MSPDIESHKLIMHKLIEVIWNSRCLDRLNEVFSRDAVIHYGDQDLNGIDQIRDDFMAPFQSAFPEMSHSIEGLVLDGKMAAMRFTGAGIHQAEYDGRPATNKNLSYEGLAMFRMKGDHIAEVWAHSNFAARFQNL